MEMTQMNIRIPIDLKNKGDEVLARFGKSASEVIRGVWEYLAEKQRLPECITENTSSSDDLARRLALIEESSHLAENYLRELGLDPFSFDISREELWEQMWEEKLREYEEL